MKKIAICFGTFDGLHQGHEDYFRQAKELADEIIVIIARDATVVDVKGNLPSTNEKERLLAVSEHPMVDDARLGYHDDKYRVLEEIRPDIICLGYDQEAFTENLDAEMARRGLSASIIRCHPYYPDTFKSSLLRGMREEEETLAEAEYEENGLPI
ncbi:MAG: adenylyltransferase/cytidyltransferase family protein [Patescibacteria group bacterium]